MCYLLCPVSAIVVTVPRVSRCCELSPDGIDLGRGVERARELRGQPGRVQPAMPTVRECVCVCECASVQVCECVSLCVRECVGVCECECVRVSAPVNCGDSQEAYSLPPLFCQLADNFTAKSKGVVQSTLQTPRTNCFLPVAAAMSFA